MRHGSRRRWPPFRPSSQVGTSDSVDSESTDADRQLDDPSTVFGEVLKDVLQSSEISTQIQRAGGVDANDLSALAEQSADTLWRPVAGDQQSAEALAEELRRLERILQKLVAGFIYKLLIYPSLQAVVMIAGLLLVVSSFGSKLLPGTDASGFSQFLYFSGVTILTFSLVDCMARYVRTRAGSPIDSARRPLLATLTGLSAATFGVVEANNLVQFRTGVRLSFWILLITDATVLAVAIYRGVARSRSQRKVETLKQHG